MEKQNQHQFYATPAAVMMHAYIGPFLSLLAVGHALGGEPITNMWGPVTNSVQMAISVIPPGGHFVRGFTVDGGTNIVPVPSGTNRWQGEVKPSEPFSLLVRIRNLSTNETFSFFYGGAYPDEHAGLSCEVISPSGKDVSPRMPPGPSIITGHAEFPTARPNQIAEFEFPLWRLCKLEETGTYKITASKRTYVPHKDQKAFVLTSNTLSITVVPDK